jgi:micrococcal nuclease
MLNAQLLVDGYAATLTMPPNVRYADVFRRFQAEAREAGRGLWGPAG